MATFAQLRTRIFSKIDDGAIQNPTTAQVDEQINLSIEYYEVGAFWFGENIANLTATIGDPILDISSVTDFGQLIEPNALVVIEGQVRHPLVHITPLEYDLINVESQGLPRWFTFRNGQIELLWFPDQAYAMTLFYRKTYADLVNDTDTNDFTDFTERLIEYKTLADLLRDYRSDFDRAAVYDAKVVEEENKIKTQTYNRTATGNLVTENVVNREGAYYSGSFY